VKKLWFKSGNQCAHLNCEQKLIDFESDTIMGIQCHIRARRPNGPRYDADMSENERNAYSNLILLCPNHHRMVDDNPEEYPPEELQRWKDKHEKDSMSAPELSSDLLEKLLLELNPTKLLVSVQQGDADILHEVADWSPSEEYLEEKDSEGYYPIVVTFDGLQELLGRVATPYRQKMVQKSTYEELSETGPDEMKPMYKQSSEWDDDEIIAAACIAAKITKSAIQSYQVEGTRRKSNLFDQL